jgi:putative protease
MSPHVRRPELTCPAGGLPALKAAVDNGADCVYVGFRDETNARAFSGLNFDVRAGRCCAHGLRHRSPRARTPAARALGALLHRATLDWAGFLARIALPFRARGAPH